MEFKTQFKIKRGTNCIMLQPLDMRDMALFDKLIEKGDNVYSGTFGTVKKTKTYKQLATVWKLVSIIFQSMEGRKPTANESRELYEDLLEEYAEKRPSKVNGKLVPVHVSEADTKACAYFIEGLMIHLAQFCELPIDAQTEVRELFFLQEYYTGQFGVDWVNQCSENEYRERHPVSEASGIGYKLHLHHIVTKGSAEALRHVTANWVMLTQGEHKELHDMGEEFFLEKYPHLVPKFRRAHSLDKQQYGKWGSDNV